MGEAQNQDDVLAALALLESNPDFRLLRRFPCAGLRHQAIDTDPLIGVVVDVETTGLDPDLDDVIELGMMKFSFDRQGRIGEILGVFNSFNEPSVPIPEVITTLTGISGSDVAGRRIATDEVTDFLSNIALVVAHNAAFDRPFCERLSPAFGELSWACSATEIDWRSEGIVGSRLEYIASSFRRFYDAHRALDDCNALVNILSLSLPHSKRLVLDTLLEAARRIKTRLFAEGAHYDLRSPLKRMGYRWNDGLNGYPRAWWKDVDPSVAEREVIAVTGLAGMDQIQPSLYRMTARNRFRRNA